MIRAVLLGLPLVFAVACTAQSEPPAQTADGPTFYKDIKPLLDSRCTSCHFEGGIAPFSLQDPEQVVQLAPLIKSAVESRRMPPYLADLDCREYIANPSLTDEQIAMVAKWADNGAPMDEPEDEGPPVEFDANALERVDLTLEMPSPFTQQADPDDYRCFLIEWPFDDVKYVTGFNAVPGTPEVVHHVVSFVIPPSRAEEFRGIDAADPGEGYTCFGGPGGTDFLSAFSIQWLSAWAPGTQGIRFPKDTGVEVVPGSLIALQVHYNSITAGRKPDLSKIQLSLEDTVERVAKVVPFTSPEWTRLRPDGQGFDDGMLVPAGAKNVVHEITSDFSFLFGFGQEYEIWASALHMHERGTKTSIYKISPDGKRECLLDIPRWQFHWQFSYWFKQPTFHAQGDRLELKCEFDNSFENQPFYNGVRAEMQDLIWGDTTTDEMCVGVIYIVKPKDQL